MAKQEQSKIDQSDVSENDVSTMVQPTPSENTGSKLPHGFKIARRVTLPLSKWKNEDSKYLRIDCAIFEGKEIAEKNGEAEKKPANLFNATDLLTGEIVQVIAATVLKGTLTEEYPDDSYVGKMFEITQHRDTAKKYNTYSITEIEAA